MSSISSILVLHYMPRNPRPYLDLKRTMHMQKCISTHDPSNPSPTVQEDKITRVQAGSESEYALRSAHRRWRTSPSHHLCFEIRRSQRWTGRRPRRLQDLWVRWERQARCSRGWRRFPTQRESLIRSFRLTLWARVLRCGANRKAREIS